MTTNTPTIVLVRGAFGDSGMWKEVIAKRTRRATAATTSYAPQSHTRTARPGQPPRRTATTTGVRPERNQTVRAGV